MTTTSTILRIALCTLLTIALLLPVFSSVGRNMNKLASGLAPRAPATLATDAVRPAAGHRS